MRRIELDDMSFGMFIIGFPVCLDQDETYIDLEIDEQVEVFQSSSHLIYYGRVLYFDSGYPCIGSNNIS